MISEGLDFVVLVFFFWLHSYLHIYLDIKKDLAGQGTENIVFLIQNIVP